MGTFSPEKILHCLFQDELLNLLTSREIVKLRSYFQAQDPQRNGFLPLSRAKEAYKNWFVSLVKPVDPCNPNYIPEEWIGDIPIDWLKRKGNEKEDTTEIQTREKKMKWDEFLQLHSLHVIAARPNTVHTKPFPPPVQRAFAFVNVELEQLPEESEIEQAERLNKILQRTHKKISKS